MKKLFLLCVIAVLAIGVITAKENNSNNVKTTVFTSGDIYCQSCVNKIMNNIPTLGKGIEDVKVDVQSKTVTVKYNASKNNDQNIIKGLKKLDVNAMVMAAGAAQQAGKQAAATPYCTMPAVAQDGNHCQNGANAAGHNCTQQDAKASAQQHCQGQQATPCTPTATTCDNDQQCQGKQASSSCCGGGNTQGKNK